MNRELQNMSEESLQSLEEIVEKELLTVEDIREQLDTTEKGKIRQSIDGRNTGLDKVSGVFSGHRIQRQAVNIQTGLGGYWPQAVYGPSDAIKGTAQDFQRKINFHRPPAESCVGIHK